jgi:hypothetical protein
LASIAALPTIRGRVVAGASALAAAVALGATLLGAVPAQAATPAKPYGTVVSGNGVILRQYPSTDSTPKGSLPYHQQVGLRCKVHAQNIVDNSIWYLLRDRAVWVTAKYVDNTGNVPLCKDVMPSSSAVLDSMPQGAQG